MRLVLLLFIFLSAVSSSSVLADNNETITRLEQAWITWAKANGVRKGAIVITLNGKPVRQSALGMNAMSYVELASLSKAVTAVCVDKLVRGRRLTYKTRLGEIFEGPFADPRVANVTIGELVTHASGFGPDSTQGSMRKWFGSQKPRHQSVTETVFKRRKQSGAAGRFLYNNENYAVLGSVIERITGGQYSEVCAQTVGGVRLRLSKKTGGFAPWGGWMMPLEDYAIFHSQHFGTHKPNSKARQALGGGAYYGLGTFWRKSGSRYNYWHFGKHCFPGRLNAGSFAVSWQGKWGVTVAYDICATDSQNNGLDAAFVDAVFR